MEIQILHLAEGAKEAKGLTVIIDVFRAFTLEAYLFANGAEEIIAVYDAEKAYELKRENPDCILLGERDGLILPGFDYGNSPAAIRDLDCRGKRFVHTTTNGVNGMNKAVNAEEMLTASLVNAKATAEYIRKKNPSNVSLVCMGWKTKRTEEDILCAEYIRSLLLDEPIEDIRKQADDLRYTEGKKFFDPLQQDAFPQDDFAMCVDVDRFDFAIGVTKKNGLFYNRKVK